MTLNREHVGDDVLVYDHEDEDNCWMIVRQSALVDIDQ